MITPQTFKRTPRYGAAINQLAAALAELSVEGLAASPSWHRELIEDLTEALEHRHQKFTRALGNAEMLDIERRGAERRSAAARKAAATRKKQAAAVRT